jgi:hypothetical protein
MKFARIAFLAGVYGIIAIVPLYFLEQVLAKQSHQPFYHPEFFYGFVGVTLAWQVAFLIIATDPLRYRPIMSAACLEKLSFAVAIPILFFLNRVSLNMVAAAGADTCLLALFVAALVVTARKKS